MLNGNITELKDLIMEIEAKQVFGGETFTDTDAKVLTYLRDLNSLYEVISPSNKDGKVACVFDCVPSNMPKKYGFAYKNEAYFSLETAFICEFLHDNIKELWVDMSQGIAIAAANAVIRMKNSGFNIKLNLAIPYRGHSDQIYGASKTMYELIKSKADVITQVSNLPKNKESFKNGLTYIIDKSSIAYYYNTPAINNTFFLKYCKDKNVDVVSFDLENLKRISK